MSSKNSARILGVDPGLNVTGYAVIETGERGPVMCEAGVVRGKDRASLTSRLGDIHGGIAEVIAQWQPGAMSLEQLYSHYQRPRTAILMGHARGVICLAAAQAGIEVHHYSATNVKKTITGQWAGNEAADPDGGDAGVWIVGDPRTGGRGRRAGHRVGAFSSTAIGSGGEVRRAACGGSQGRGGDGGTRRLITRITGKLLSVGDEAVTLAIEAFEYEVRIPEFCRRQLQHRLGEEVSLHTIDYLEGNPVQGRLTPRLIGFLSEIERDFFELFCSVDGVGVKKALRAMVRPVPEVAAAIEEQDAKALSALPGIGPAASERIIAKLRRKVPKFALLVARDVPAQADVEKGVVEETFEVLKSLGHNDADARRLLDAALSRKKNYKDVQQLLQAVYDQSHGG